MFNTIKKVFSRRYLGVSILDDKVRAIDLDHGVPLIHGLSQILSESARNRWDGDAVDIWTDETAFSKVIEYCTARMTKDRGKLILAVAVPEEISKQQRTILLEKTPMKIRNLKKLYLIEEVIAAAIGATSKDIQLIGENEINKKLYILSQKNQTIFSVIWAGALVQSHRINKGYDNLCFEDIEQQVEHLISQLPEEVPSKFLKNQNIAPYLKMWEVEIDKIYCSIPDRRRFSIGNTAVGCKIYYTKYDEFLIADGLKEILKSI